MKLEKDLMKQISQRLGTYKLCGEVVWFHRIQSGKAKVGQYYIQLADAGTPDWFVLIRMRNDTLGALFIEAKSDKGILRDCQQKFIDRFMNKRDVHILILRDINELDKWIDKNAKDFVNELPNEL